MQAELTSTLANTGDIPDEIARAMVELRFDRDFLGAVVRGIYCRDRTRQRGKLGDEKGEREAMLTIGEAVLAAVQRQRKRRTERPVPQKG